MARSARGLASLVVLASVIFVACSGSSATWPAPGSTPPGGAGSDGSTVPSPPTAFVVRVTTQDVKCTDSADMGCVELEFTWTSDAGPSTWFVIYRGYVSIQGNEQCASTRKTAELLVKSSPGARSVKFVEQFTVGAGVCFWISAANAAGESERAPETVPPIPPTPTEFSAGVEARDAPCPSGYAEPCWRWAYAWQSAADSTTWYAIYRAQAPADGDCAAVKDEAMLAIETDPGALELDQVETIPEWAVGLGGADVCHWISAVNTGGESDWLLAAR